MFAQAIPSDLRCQGLIDPAGIDQPAPRLSWILLATQPGERNIRQTGYQILASSTSDRLSKDHGDLWDSGRVNAGDSLHIDYQGKPLASGQQVFWKVKVWTQADQAGPSSAAAHWTMGLLSPHDWDPARWIALATAPKQAGSTLLRREFSVRPRLKHAVIFVTGLGQYELSINGQKIGNQLLSPGWTNYRKTILYDTFDVTSNLRSGDNAIGIILGDGMYNIQPTSGRYVKFTQSFGPCKAIARLVMEYEDGSVGTLVSDHRWKATLGPITYSNVYGGEDFDARNIIAGWDRPDMPDSPQWQDAVETEGPGGQLRGQSVSAPAIQAIESHKPFTMKQLTPSATIYDLRQNASHMPQVHVHGPAGSAVRIIPSELLGPDGNIDRASCVQDAGGPAWWQYTLAGTGDEYFFPKFFYQGCRYFRVERQAPQSGGELPVVDSIVGVVVHSSAEPISTFECSNDLFNKTYSLVRWAQRSNMMSLMTDCPQREKLGWLEELHLNGPSLRYNFRMDNLYSKEMNDMADAQLDNGLVPNIAPEYFLAHTNHLDDPFRNSPEWGSAMLIVPWQQYLFTGDLDLLREHYSQMAHYIEFIAASTKNGILTVGLGDWYDIGPKPPWGSQLTPRAFTATAIYYYDTTIMAAAADLLGHPDQAKQFRQRAEETRNSINKTFFDPRLANYATGSQCANAMALALGIAEPDARPAVLANLIADVRARGNALSAGDVGYRFVLRALADAGRSDVIFDMNNQANRPGYGMQLSRGATSLTEKWDASVGKFGSQDHFMLGQINEWFFHDLAGIQSDPDAPGFSHIIIKPAIVGDLSRLKVTYVSNHGTIIVEWKKQGDQLELWATIPPNTSANIYVPTSQQGSVKQNGPPIEIARKDSVAHEQPGYDCFSVGSGAYDFSSR